MIQVKQVTPLEIYEKSEYLLGYFNDNMSNLITGRVWMTEMKDIVNRFRLLNLKDMSKEEIYSYSWDTERVNTIIHETFNEVSRYFPYDEVSITVFPALPFHWLEKHDRSIWTNGFTNGANNVQIAVPPNPDEEFLKYMLAHELHHATPINPIYELSLDHFPLFEWLKMEGGAELFALSLYEDKRWWKDDFSSEVEDLYWGKVKPYLDTVDDSIKNPLCFGDPKNGIPYLTGYAFAYKVFQVFSLQYPNYQYREMLNLDSLEVIQVYERLMKHDKI